MIHWTLGVEGKEKYRLFYYCVSCCAIGSNILSSNFDADHVDSAFKVVYFSNRKGKMYMKLIRGILSYGLSFWMRNDRTEKQFDLDSVKSMKNKISTNEKTKTKKKAK